MIAPRFLALSCFARGVSWIALNLRIDAMTTYCLSASLNPAAPSAINLTEHVGSSICRTGG
jgi:hypothetical protein